jgi:hypothetical protein
LRVQQAAAAAHHARAARAIHGRLRGAHEELAHMRALCAQQQQPQQLQPNGW